MVESTVNGTEGHNTSLDNNPSLDPMPSADQQQQPQQRTYQDRYEEIAQLAGGLAHEVRNPLSTIRLNLDLLAEDFEEAENTRDRRVRQKLDRIRAESLRLESILENFLRFLRVKELRIEAADFNAVIDDVREFLEPLAEQQGIVIRTQYEPDLPRVDLDLELFRQNVLFNLMRNAQLAMPEGGELMLVTRREGPWLVFEITDTGCGIPEEIQERIFAPFFSTRQGGTGLGLPMARKVAEIHGGTLSVESEVGKGSRFTVRLPVPESGQTPEPARPG